MIYIDLLLVAFITIYIVDLSGFTQSWLDVLSHYKGKKVVSFKPFSCGLCMVWWMCLLYALCVRQINLFTIAFSALLSILSIPLGQVMIFIREAFISLTDRLLDLCSRRR